MNPGPVALGCLMALAAGCTVPSDTPAWAVANVHLQPGSEAAVHGWVNWQLYDARWESTGAEQAYLCSALGTLQGTRTDACPDCDDSWEVSVEPDTTDCPTDVWLEHPLLGSITGVGTGSMVPDADAPPEAELGTWIRYEGDWLPHGWATSQDVHVQAWPEGQSLDLHAAWTWPL